MILKQNNGRQQKQNKHLSTKQYISYNGQTFVLVFVTRDRKQKDRLLLFRKLFLLRYC